MSSIIWYISKYVTPPSSARVGARGFLLLQEFVKRGHKCIMFTSDSNHLAEPTPLTVPSFREQVNGVDVIWLRTLKYQGARSIKRIFSWFDFEWQLWKLPKCTLPKPDVIIVSSLSLLSVCNGIRLKRRYKAKLVVEIRDIWPMVLYEEGGFSRYNPFVLALAWVEKQGYKNADLIVGTMPNLGEHVKEILGYAKPVECVPMGVDENLIDSSDEVDPEYISTHIPRGKFTVCHAGTIGVTNALDTFFETAWMMKDMPSIQFLMLGEGYMKADYQAQCADLPNVSFAPRVDKSKVQSVLARCDLLYFAVHPSKVLRFGQSLNKVIDYMLSGKPVVASFSGYPSMINEAGSGSYVPANDAAALYDEILRYVEMPHKEREKIGAQGRMWLLENRKFDALADTYLNILDLNIKAEIDGD